MAVGLRLTAKLAASTENAQEFLGRLAEWIKHKCAELQPEIREGTKSESPSIFCRLHPAAEAVEFAFVAPNGLQVSATTSSAGPGYHIYLVSLLKNWAREFQASWQRPEDDSPDFGDETGYFSSGDESQVFDSMTNWLQKVARLFFDGTVDRDATGIALSLSPDAYFESDAPAITPLGPRTREWLRETAQDGARGRDFFAWWAPVLNAEFFLGRALNLMWTKIRWRTPVDDAETDALKMAADSLARAHQLDPHLPYPWAEWREILELLKANPPERELVLANAHGQPAIGYRRGNVVVTLPGGWRIRVPGSFSDFELSKHGDLFALDPPREIWFTSFRFRETLKPPAFESVVKKMRESQHQYFEETGQYAAMATVNKKKRETGEEYYEMNTMNASLASQAVLTIVYARADEEPWAVEIWKSLCAPGHKED